MFNYILHECENEKMYASIVRFRVYENNQNFMKEQVLVHLVINVGSLVPVLVQYIMPIDLEGSQDPSFLVCIVYVHYEPELDVWKRNLKSLNPTENLTIGAAEPSICVCKKGSVITKQQT